MLVKNIYVHVVYNCSVCNGVKSCLNIDNPKLGELWSGGCLNKSHGGCEFLFFCTIFHSVLQICWCPGSVTCGGGIGCSMCTLSPLQGNQSSTDLATSPAAAEGTGFAPKYTDYCQGEQRNVACFTPAEDLTQGIEKKKIELKVIKCKLCQSLTNFNSGSNFFNFCFTIAHIFHKQFSSVRLLGANCWVWQAPEVCVMVGNEALSGRNWLGKKLISRRQESISVVRSLH